LHRSWTFGAKSREARVRPTGARPAFVDIAAAVVLACGCGRLNYEATTRDGGLAPLDAPPAADAMPFDAGSARWRICADADPLDPGLLRSVHITAISETGTHDVWFDDVYIGTREVGCLPE